MTHTLGPWTLGAEWVAPAEKDAYLMTSRNGQRIFVIRDGLIPTLEDARLIAAAPDLLAALQGLVNFPNDIHKMSDALEAIAKATGGAA